MDRVDKALKLRAQGLNCAQAVAAAFEDKVDFDMDTLIAISTGFGSGGGDMQGTCGALSAVYLICSMIISKKYAGDPMAKALIMKANRQMAQKFRSKNKSTICKELKGVETGQVLRSCNGAVEDAAAILDEFLTENQL